MWHDWACKFQKISLINFEDFSFENYSFCTLVLEFSSQDNLWNLKLTGGTTGLEHFLYICLYLLKITFIKCRFWSAFFPQRPSQLYICANSFVNVLRKHRFTASSTFPPPIDRMYAVYKTKENFYYGNYIYIIHQTVIYKLYLKVIIYRVCQNFGLWV